MNYPYTATNLLREPHAYMYSPYGDVDFLHWYIKDRLERLNTCSSQPDLSCNAEKTRLNRLANILLDELDNFPPLGIELRNDNLEEKPYRSAAYS